MKTTIQVDKLTLEQLKKIKIVKKESYNEVIIRLLIMFKREENDKKEKSTSTV